MGFVIPPYKTTNMDIFILAVVLLTFVALMYGYLHSEDNEIVIEFNKMQIPYFKLGIYMERFHVSVRVEEEGEIVEKIQQEDVIAFSLVFISLQITFFKILDA